jgi:hypothetical protein
MLRHDQTCVHSMMPLQKNSRSTCFFCLPQKYLQSFLKKTQGGKHNLFLDCMKYKQLQ